MMSFKLKTVLGVICLAFTANNALAELKTDKTVIDSSTGVATISVSVAKPVTGDLYLATPLDGRLHFFADNGTQLITTVSPFIAKGYFSGERAILKLARDGIPPGEYSLFQVLTAPGKDPLDGNNWLGGLSELKFRINLPVEGDLTPFSPITLPESTPTPTPTAPVIVPPKEEVTCTVAKESDSEHEADNGQATVCNTASVSTSPDGKSLYNANCSSAGCHGANPNANRYNVLNGKDAGVIRGAINKNKGNMGLLKSITDANLQAIANYLKTL